MRNIQKQFFLSGFSSSADTPLDNNAFSVPKARQVPHTSPKAPPPDTPMEGSIQNSSIDSLPESIPAEPEFPDAEAADFGSGTQYYLVPDEDARVLDYQKKITTEPLDPIEVINFSRDLEIIDESLFDPVRNTFELEAGFAETVLKKIDEKGLTDPQCYTRANLSRAVFNKLKQSALFPEKCSYSPSKSTALALAIALELSLDDANDLLKKAGFAISHSNKRDIIVEYFLVHQIYDIFAINEVLFRFQQPPLGSL